MNEAMTFLKKYFGYDESLLTPTFEELLDGGILSHVAVAEYTVPNTIELTARGKYTLNRLIRSIEYLNLALQAAPVPAYLVEKKLFPIREYESPEFVIFNKIISTINFIRYLKQVEEQEERVFNQELGESSPKSFSYLHYKSGGFGVCSEIEVSVIGAIRNMVASAWKFPGKLKGDLEIMVSNNLLGVKS